MLCRLLVVALLAISPLARGEDCAALAKIKGVTLAETVTSGTLTPAGEKQIMGLPPFCRVRGTLTPSPDSAIQVEVWLPLKAWNERLKGTGNGGLAGHIQYRALVAGVKAGYAVANTDMGMGTPEGKDASVFINRPERWKDWGWRSTHDMTVFAKIVVNAFYGRPEKKAYFEGCSTGGEQALMEAQRFPDDYDGIVGGAPAHDRTGVHEDILWNFDAMERTPGAYLPAEKLKLLHAAVVQACDLNDGIQDGLIGDPRLCHFDASTLLCKASDMNTCLTAPQVEAVKKIYTGPSDPRSGKTLYPGLEPGSEFAWGALGGKPPMRDAPYSPVFKWVFGPDWSWQSFDYGKDADTLQATLADSLNATDPNLDSFIDHGHKLLLYHGWADQIVAPEETIHYFDTVRARRDVASSVRLFLLPGVAHCGGGPGPAQVDELSAVVRWVEDGLAPGTLRATGTTEDSAGKKLPMTRPLCPYPTAAKYNGTGDIDEMASYACLK